jgi:hypothetical protein
MITPRDGLSFFESTAGLLGVAPSSTQPGDEIAIPLGSRVPFVLRRSQEHNHFLLIGECFVVGLMVGEAMEDLDETRVEELFFW